MPKIVTATERMKEGLARGTVLVLGEYEVGKTSLLYTLPAESTLAIDYEGGFKSVAKWGGDSISIRSWRDALNLVCYIGGPDPAVRLQTSNYSAAHYAHALSLYGPNGTESRIDLRKYRYFFFDSVSELMAAKFKDAEADNQVLDKNKQVTTDTRGQYGDVGNHVLDMIRHMQHHPANIIWLGRLEWHVDEAKRGSWRLQGDGQKVGNHMPGVVDQVVTMARMRWINGQFEHDNKSDLRAFVCRRANPWDFPAKERTQGNVDLIEEPHLGKLIDKINQPARDYIART